jgi:hypothetical protein
LGAHAMTPAYKDNNQPLHFQVTKQTPMNEPAVVVPTSTISASIKLESTARSVLSSWFNISMMVILLMYCIFSIYVLLIKGFTLVLHPLLFFAVPFLFLYVWSVFTRSIEINDEHIRYKEAFRDVLIRWDDLDSVKIERLKGQINFRVRGKLVRVHTYGLDKKRLVELNDIFIKQANAHNVPIQITQL